MTFAPSCSQLASSFQHSLTIIFIVIYSHLQGIWRINIPASAPPTTMYCLNVCALKRDPMCPDSQGPFLLSSLHKSDTTFLGTLLLINKRDTFPDSHEGVTLGLHPPHDHFVYSHKNKLNSHYYLSQDKGGLLGGEQRSCVAFLSQTVSRS